MANLIRKSQRLIPIPGSLPNAPVRSRLRSAELRVVKVPARVPLPSVFLLSGMVELAEQHRWERPEEEELFRQSLRNLGALKLSV